MEKSQIKNVVVFAAMDKEIDVMTACLQNKVFFNDADAVEGDMFGKRFCFVKTGIGSIKTVFKATQYLTLHKPDLIINVGCIGAHLFNADYGDLVLVDNFWGTVDFLSDGLEQIATDKEISKELYSYLDGKVVFGDVASGDLWRTKEQIEEFARQYGTVGEDMEGFYLAFCAEKYCVPFVSVKFVSNNELAQKPYKFEFFKDCQKSILKVLEKFFEA